MPALLAASHTVTGTTRSSARAGALADSGATPVIVDAFGKSALTRAVAETQPDVVVNQLTALPRSPSVRGMKAAYEENDRARGERARDADRGDPGRPVLRGTPGVPAAPEAVGDARRHDQRDAENLIPEIGTYGPFEEIIATRQHVADGDESGEGREPIPPIHAMAKALRDGIEE